MAEDVVPVPYDQLPQATEIEATDKVFVLQNDLFKFADQALFRGDPGIAGFKLEWSDDNLHWYNTGMSPSSLYGRISFDNGVTWVAVAPEDFMVRNVPYISQGSYERIFDMEYLFQQSGNAPTTVIGEMFASPEAPPTSSDGSGLCSLTKVAHYYIAEWINTVDSYASRAIRWYDQQQEPVTDWMIDVNRDELLDGSLKVAKAVLADKATLADNATNANRAQTANNATNAQTANNALTLNGATNSAFMPSYVSRSGAWTVEDIHKLRNGFYGNISTIEGLPSSWYMLIKNNLNNDDTGDGSAILINLVSYRIYTGTWIPAFTGWKALVDDGSKAIAFSNKGGYTNFEISGGLRREGNLYHIGIAFVSAGVVITGEELFATVDYGTSGSIFEGRRMVVPFVVDLQGTTIYQQAQLTTGYAYISDYNIVLKPDKGCVFPNGIVQNILFTVPAKI